MSRAKRPCVMTELRWYDLTNLLVIYVNAARQDSPYQARSVRAQVPMFSFLRLSGADPHTGVEMQSTGEVACLNKQNKTNIHTNNMEQHNMQKQQTDEIKQTGEVASFGRDAQEAFLKGMISGGFKLPVGPGGVSLATGVLLSLGPQDDKKCFAPYVALLAELGHKLYATSGTHAYFESQSITCKGKPVPITMLHNAVTQKEPNVTNEIKAKTVRIVITTPSSRDSGGATAGYFLRRRAMDGGMALIVDIRQAMKLVDALYQKYQCEQNGREFWSIESWHESHRIG